jgi:hypothetical protein
MFLFHAAISLGLIALASGTALLVWAMRNQGAGTSVAKVFGYIVVILASLSILCSIYSAVHTWRVYHHMQASGVRMVQMQPMMNNNAAPNSANKHVTPAQQHNKY